MQKWIKNSLIILEVVGWIIFAVAVYSVAMRLFLNPPEWMIGQILFILTGMGFSPKIGFIIILTFGILSVAIMKFWRPKNMRLKIGLLLLMFTSWAAYATAYVFACLLRDFKW